MADKVSVQCPRCSSWKNTEASHDSVIKCTNRSCTHRFKVRRVDGRKPSNCAPPLPEPLEIKAGRDKPVRSKPPERAEGKAGTSVERTKPEPLVRRIPAIGTVRTPVRATPDDRFQTLTPNATRRCDICKIRTYRYSGRIEAAEARVEVWGDGGIIYQGEVCVRHAQEVNNEPYLRGTVKRFYRIKAGPKSMPVQSGPYVSDQALRELRHSRPTAPVAPTMEGSPHAIGRAGEIVRRKEARSAEGTTLPW